MTAFSKIDVAAPKETRPTLHGYARLLGRVREQIAPSEKHFWNLSLKLTPRGYTTGPLRGGSAGKSIVFELKLDCFSHSKLGAHLLKST